MLAETPVILSLPPIDRCSIIGKNNHVVTDSGAASSYLRIYLYYTGVNFIIEKEIMKELSTSSHSGSKKTFS